MFHDHSGPEAVIASRHNPLVKRVRGLARRAARMAEGVILIEGLRAIIEAVWSGVAIETMLYAPDRLRSDLARATVSQAREAGARVVLVEAALLDEIADRDASQGLIAVAARPAAAIAAVPTTGAPLVIALFEPQDPGNVGAIARTADGAGAAALVTCGARGVDVFDPKAVRASMGSLFALPVIELGDMIDAIASLRGRGLAVVGAAGSGKVDLWHAPLAGPVAIVMGNERAGLPPEALAACDVVARIPMAGRADSLNVAAAAAIFAFEAVRQHATTRSR